MAAAIPERTGPDGPVPDVSTLSRRQKTLAVRTSSRRAPGPLNLPADRTGITFGTEGGWPERAARIAGAGARKVHPAMDAATGGYPGGGVRLGP